MIRKFMSDNTIKLKTVERFKYLKKRMVDITDSKSTKA
jgi:hypothetical protein